MSHGQLRKELERDQRGARGRMVRHHVAMQRRLVVRGWNGHGPVAPEVVVGQEDVVHSRRCASSRATAAMIATRTASSRCWFSSSNSLRNTAIAASIML